ncbi:hypothetical protein, partial [Candidatus Neptunochlamydia vexilliferae]|uniref:hypothetical protein n=1 Tax=Candidatus Neptunichlamydia vexilliferae TaxID=1651774 RepID=UPI001891DDE3
MASSSSSSTHTPSNPILSSYISDRAALGLAINRLSKKEDPFGKLLYELAEKNVDPQWLKTLHRPEVLFTHTFFSSAPQEEENLFEKFTSFFSKKAPDGPQTRLTKLLRLRLSNNHPYFQRINQQIKKLEKAARERPDLRKHQQAIKSLIQHYHQFKQDIINQLANKRLNKLAGPVLLCQNGAPPLRLPQKLGRRLCSIGKQGQGKKTNLYGASAVTQLEGIFFKRAQFNPLSPGEEFLVKSFSTLLSPTHGSAATLLLKIKNIWTQNAQ